MTETLPERFQQIRLLHVPFLVGDTWQKLLEYLYEKNDHLSSEFEVIIPAIHHETLLNSNETDPKGC